MITEIEMLKKRVEFLEKTLYCTLYTLRRREGSFLRNLDNTIDFNYEYQTMKDWINSLEEEYKTKVAKEDYSYLRMYELNKCQYNNKICLKKLYRNFPYNCDECAEKSNEI